MEQAIPSAFSLSAERDVQAASQETLATFTEIALLSYCFKPLDVSRIANSRLMLEFQCLYNPTLTNKTVAILVSFQLFQSLLNRRMVSRYSREAIRVYQRLPMNKKCSMLHHFRVVTIRRFNNQVQL
jgi:hypothetical protein